MQHSSDGVVAKLIENWWTNANERSFQYQFAFQLASDSFDVIHVTRHCGMEFGKDVIARSHDGIVHCYQLKSGFGERLRLSEWQKLSSQIDDLVALPIKHPSLDGGGIATEHQPWFVVNGYLNEEVQRQIEDRNITYRQRYGRELKTVVLGEMVRKSVSTTNSVWPTTPEINHELFSAYIKDGRRQLDKSAFFDVLKALMPTEESKTSPRSLNRIADSLAVVTSLYTANPAKQQNWISQIDAWTICWGLMASVFERHGLDPASKCGSFRLTQVILASLLDGFSEEVSENPKLGSNESAANNAFGVAHVRTTKVVGYLAANAIRQSETGVDSSKTMGLFEHVLGSNRQMELWGEAASPSLLAFWLAQQHNDATLKADMWLWSLLDAVLAKLESRQVYPDPYTSTDEFAICVAKKDGIKLEQMMSQRESFWLRVIVEASARQFWRQRLARKWGEISLYGCVKFETAESWQYLLWRSEKGTYKTEFWPEPTSWATLLAQSNRSGDLLPTSLKQQAWITMLFLIVFPHRALPDAVCWAEKKLERSATNI